MALLDELVQKYAAVDLASVFTKVGIDNSKIRSVNRQILKEVTLAQWLLESARATSNLALEANNFSGLKWRSEMTIFAESLRIKVISEDREVEFCKFNNVDAFIVGYWKFLTRSPYQGWEAHTNTPETFIGFLRRRGYAADLNYVSKVISLLPEAQKLLAQAKGVTFDLSTRNFQVTSSPQEVEVGQGFVVEGIASLTDSGKTLSVKIDDRFENEGTTINPDGKWQVNFVFYQPGSRRMQISTSSETVEILIKATTPVDADDDPETPTPSGSIVINLSGSVGRGGVNRNKDAIAIKKRLHELGYTWVGDPSSSKIDTGTIAAIKLFQSIIAGKSRIAGDGRVDVGGPTHRWLQAKNAPTWVTMPASDRSIGFFNFELNDRRDNHDYGTGWLYETIMAIAKDYQASYRNSHPDAALFTINNVSMPHGGDTPFHGGHETGLMCDVLLPRKDSKSGGIYYWDSNYDPNATRAILKSIRKQKLVRAVFFNDPNLIRENLCVHIRGHHHHIHFEINPPVRS